MNRDEVFSAIKTIIRKEINNEQLVIEENMTALDIEGWDSLSHMSIISSIETYFNVSFSFIDVVNLEKVSDLVDLAMDKAGF